ncbi:sugar phosphate isomerase/epimerase family protein [Bacteroidota bacterium]
MKFSRRNFLRLSGTGILASQAPLVLAFSNNTGQKKDFPIPFKLGIASYTFREFTLKETIAMTQRLEITMLALKSMHLPLDATAEQIQLVGSKVREAGIELYGAGVIYMKTKEEVDTAFEYAKQANLTTIIGVPEYELLEYCSQKVQEYDIILAIHNHGPDNQTFQSPKSVYERVKDLDWRMGLCVDIGHTQRLGQDPIEETKKYMDRVFDIHIKDVDRSDADGSTLELGHGVIDIPGFLKMLIKENYQRVVSFEYEKDEKDPLPGLAESVGYVRGVLETIK